MPTEDPDRVLHNALRPFTAPPGAEVVINIEIADIGIGHMIAALDEIHRRYLGPQTNSASQRAEETLCDLLTIDQLRDYGTKRYFDVTGSEGNTYRIRTDHNPSGNVGWIDADGFTHGIYCAHPHQFDELGRSLPYADHYLGQFLALTTDENHFLKVANVFAGTTPRTFRGWPERRPLWVRYNYEWFVDRYYRDPPARERQLRIFGFDPAMGRVR